MNRAQKRAAKAQSAETPAAQPDNAPAVAETTIVPAGEEAKGTLTLDARPIATLEKLVTFDGERVTLSPDAHFTTSEFADLIADRKAKGDTSRGQACWLYYSAGLLPDGAKVQKVIAGKLKSLMTPAAADNLTSLARRLCPVIVANGLKTPITVLAEASVGGDKAKHCLLTNAEGKFLPESEQTPVGREVLPLLLGDKPATQAAIRTLRASKPQKDGGTGANPAPEVTPAEKAAAEAKAKDAEETKAAALAVDSLAVCNRYLLRALPSPATIAPGVNLTFEQVAKMKTLVTETCRLLGLNASVGK